MFKAARTLALTTAVAALTLTGCVASPSTGVKVGDVAIPDATVRETARAVTAVADVAPAAALQTSVADLAMGEAARQIAARKGITVTEGDKEQVLARSASAQKVIAIPGGKAWGDAVSTAFLVIQELGREEAAAQFRDVEIVVNPRYGAWSAKDLTLVDASLSRVANPALLRR